MKHGGYIFGPYTAEDLKLRRQARKEFIRDHGRWFIKTGSVNRQGRSDLYHTDVEWAYWMVGAPHKFDDAKKRGKKKETKMAKKPEGKMSDAEAALLRKIRLKNDCLKSGGKPPHQGITLGDLKTEEQVMVNRLGAKGYLRLIPNGIGDQMSVELTPLGYILACKPAKKPKQKLVTMSKADVAALNALKVKHSTEPNKDTVRIDPAMTTTQLNAAAKGQLDPKILALEMVEACGVDLMQIVQDLTDAQAVLSDVYCDEAMTPDQAYNQRQFRLTQARAALGMGRYPYKPVPATPVRIACEICGADPSTDANVMLHRINELGSIGIWRCHTHANEKVPAPVDAPPTPSLQDKLNSLTERVYRLEQEARQPKESMRDAVAKAEPATPFVSAPHETPAGNS